MQPRGDFGPHQLNNAGAGSDATRKQIAAQLYAPRSAPLPGDRRNHRVDATFNQDLFAPIHPAPSIGRRSRRQGLVTWLALLPVEYPRAQNATDYLPRAA
jgi:hypothetical protein